MLLALAACSAPSVADSAPAADAAWSGVDAWDPPAPDWGPAQVEAEISAVLAQGFPTPVPTALDFEAFIARVAAEGAPGGTGARIEAESIVAEYDGEGSLQDGTTYEGGWIYTKATTPDPQGNLPVELRFLASFTLVDPDGLPYIRGGETRAHIVHTPDGSGEYFYKLGGRWSYPAADSWVGLDQSAAMEMKGTRTAAGDALLLQGGIDGTLEVYVRDLTFDPAVCGGLPVGELLVRDPTWYWHTITLTDDCSGCGQAEWAGAAEGEVCVGDILVGAAKHAVDDLWDMR